LLAEQHHLSLLVLPLKALHLLNQVDLGVNPVFGVLDLTDAVQVLVEVFIMDA
jgi:hypothetical protein